MPGLNIFGLLKLLDTLIKRHLFKIEPRALVEVADKKWTHLSFSLLLRLLNHISAFHLNLLLLIDVVLVLIALQVGSFFAILLLIGDVALAADHEHQIFEVFPYDNKEDGHLDSKHGCYGRERMRLVLTILFSDPLLAIHYIVKAKRHDKHGYRAPENFSLQLHQVRLVAPIWCDTIAFGDLEKRKH